MVRQLEQAAVALFDAYSMPVRAGEVARVVYAPSAEPSIMAVMGFVGEGVRGALTMIAAESTVLAWLDAMGETGGDCADVLGEFANMLLGRLKTALLPEGMAIQVSTPTTASGNSLRLSNSPALSRWFELEGAGWELMVRLDTTFDSDFALREIERADAAPAQAGEAIFF